VLDFELTRDAVFQSIQAGPRFCVRIVAAHDSGERANTIC